MGAVMPSGRVLARTMAQYVDIDSSEPVVELGPGTGAITSGVDRARRRSEASSCWSNTIRVFCAFAARTRYPHAKVVQGDAYALRDSLWNMLSALPHPLWYPACRSSPSRC